MKDIGQLIYNYMTKDVDGEKRPAIGVKHKFEDSYVLLDEFNIRALNRMMAIHKKEMESADMIEEI
jgi:hypothetical protein